MLPNYRLHSSARVNESAVPLAKKLPWARIKLATFKPWAEHCTTDPSNLLSLQERPPRTIQDIRASTILTLIFIQYNAIYHWGHTPRSVSPHQPFGTKPAASPHASPLLIPSNSQQEASTCHSHELCCRPHSLLHSWLSLSETTW